MERKPSSRWRKCERFWRLDAWPFHLLVWQNGDSRTYSWGINITSPGDSEIEGSGHGHLPLDATQMEAEDELTGLLEEALYELRGCKP